MTDTNYQPQDSAVIGQISTYLQQLILMDALAKVISAQEKGGDCLPLLKSLRDCAESQGVEREKAEWGFIFELCSLAARAAQQRSGEPCTDD